MDAISAICAVFELINQIDLNAEIEIIVIHMSDMRVGWTESCCSVLQGSGNCRRSYHVTNPRLQNTPNLLAALTLTQRCYIS